MEVADHRSRLNRVARWAGRFFVFLVVWTLFISKLDWQETLLGAIAAVATLFTVHAYDCTGLVKFKPRWRDLGRAWRIPAAILSDTALITRALGEQLAHPGSVVGLTLAVPFDIGGDNPADAARRAIAVTYSTVTPNAVVFGLCDDPAAPGRGLLLVHQMVPTPTSRTLLQLGALA